jgi:hypothetical protein
VYVHLKHTLSALTLAAVGNPRLRATVAWLAANAERLAGPDGVDAARVPRWLITHQVLERRGTVAALADGYQPYAGYLRRQARRSARTLEALARAPRGRTKIEAVRRGAALFNGGLFFECHEYFEGLWRRGMAADRGFYQGIILVAAGFYHIEKGNSHGARSKLTAGVDRLRQYPSEHLGVQLSRWLAALEPWLARVRDGGALGVLEIADVPRIPLAVRRVR